MVSALWASWSDRFSPAEGKRLALISLLPEQFFRLALVGRHRGVVVLGVEFVIVSVVFACLLVVMLRCDVLALP